MPQIELVSLRPWHPRDYNFVKATWIRALRFGGSWLSNTDGPAYYKTYSAVLDAILSSPVTVVTVACLTDEPDVILGYLAHRGDTLDFVYVRKRWRGLGIAKSLLPTTFTKVSHLTKTGQSILNKKYPGVQFNPFN